MDPVAAADQPVVTTGRLVVPPYLEPAGRKVHAEFEEMAGGGFAVHAVAGRTCKRTGVRVEVRPEGVSIYTKATKPPQVYPRELILEVRPGGSTGVCLGVRRPEPGPPERAWRRVVLPVLRNQNEQTKGIALDVLRLAGPWLAGEVARVLRRPPLPDAYVARPGWVDSSVEEAGRHGRLVYGTTVPPEHAEPVPPVRQEGSAPRLDVPPRKVRWSGVAASAVLIGIAWLIGVGVCAGLTGPRVFFFAGVFGVVGCGLMVASAGREILAARQHLTVAGAEPRAVEVRVHGVLRRRHRRLTPENTRAVFLAPGDRTDRLLVTPDTGKDRVLLWGFDRAVLAQAAGLIERHLGLTPSDPAVSIVGDSIVNAAPPLAIPAVPVAAVAPPTDPPPERWVVREGFAGPGSWSVTRPADSIRDKLRTAGCLVGVLAIATVVGLVVSGPWRGFVALGAGLYGLLMLVRRIDRALWPATVAYDGAAVEISSRGLFGRVHVRLEAWGVERVVVGPVMAVDSNRPESAVELVRRDGARHGVIGIISEPSARWLARKLASSLNMTEDVTPIARE